jgi:hypothetical protein
VCVGGGGGGGMVRERQSMCERWGEGGGYEGVPRRPGGWGGSRQVRVGREQGCS